MMIKLLFCYKSDQNQIKNLKIVGAWKFQSYFHAFTTEKLFATIDFKIKLS